MIFLVSQAVYLTSQIQAVSKLGKTWLKLIQFKNDFKNLKKPTDKGNNIDGDLFVKSRQTKKAEFQAINNMKICRKIVQFGFGAF